MGKGYMIWKQLLLISVLFLSTSSCSKQGSTTTNTDCIVRVIPLYTETTLTEYQINSIKLLFSKNNMSINGLQFTQFISDGGGNLPMITQTQVTANLFLNDLPVFYYNELFIFNNGIFDTAYLYTGTPLTNDITGHQTLSNLQSSFLKHVSESITYLPIGPPFVPSSSTYSDSCLVATLGYIDAVYIPGHTLPWGNLIKVWSVTTLHNSYPTVYVEDDNGLAWGMPVYIP
jgi:hypothetical protein